MFEYLQETLATLLEYLRKPMDIHEGKVRVAGQLKFQFTYLEQTYHVTVYCNERTYLCTYAGLTSFRRKYPIYEVYSVIGGLEMVHEISHVFDMVIFFPAIGNRFCSSRQHAMVAIDAYVSVITQRFKEHLAATRLKKA